MNTRSLRAQRRWERYQKQAAIEAVCHYRAIKTDPWGGRVPWTKAEIVARYRARERLKNQRRVERAYWRQHDPDIS